MSRLRITPQNLEVAPGGAGTSPGQTVADQPGSTGSIKTGSIYETYRPESRSADLERQPGAHPGLDPCAGPAVGTGVLTRSDSRRIIAARRRRQRQHRERLDHLPPLDLPSDVTDKSLTPPVAPAAQRKPQTPAPATASDHVGGRSPREPELTLTGTADAGGRTRLVPRAGAPGIARFAAVDLKLAGGSVPSTAGLDWLADKGYKTLVDLRESSQANLAFIAAATERGFRYVALPVSVKTIDRDHLARFNFELALADARPLYFFDGDGTRAGALWYLRRVPVDHVNPQIARREAADLGLHDTTTGRPRRAISIAWTARGRRRSMRPGPSARCDRRKRAPAARPQTSSRRKIQPAAPQSKVSQGRAPLPETASRPASERGRGATLVASTERKITSQRRLLPVVSGSSRLPARCRAPRGGRWRAW